MKKLLKVLSIATLGLTLLFTSCDTGFITNFDEEDFSVSDTHRSVFASNTVTYTMAPEIYELVGEGYNKGKDGPVIITKGTLKSGWSSKTVYLVTLSGTEFVDNQSTGLITDLLSGFNLDNAYLRNVVSIISNNIPANSNIVLAGHSLGGMVAQQVAANETLKKNYNILNTVTFGSPLLSAGSREGTVKRLGDTNDAIPYASGSLFNNTVWAIAGLNRENGGYKFASEDAHVKSYARTDLWGKYDVTGTKNGNAKIILNLNTKKFYQSPTNIDN